MAKGKVLVVDDEPGIRALLQLILEDGGCEPISASTPLEGIRLAGELRPAMAILDYMLPQMNGVELGIWLRARLGEDFPLLFMSVVDIPRSELAQIESYLFISKPFDVSNVLEAVDSALAPVRPLPFTQPSPVDDRLAG
ncbi:MAG: response regulator [Chloroflexi bacterium]|nr:response regulator [Chloroflexota bacterium]